MAATEQRALRKVMYRYLPGNWLDRREGAGVSDCINDALTARQTVKQDTGKPSAFIRTGCYVWLLRRNCSLSPRQSLFATGLLAALPIFIAVLFAIAGLWTVLPCALIEMSVVGSCFLLYARHAPDYERIELTDEILKVVQCSGSRVRQFEVNPLWVSVRLGDGHNPPIHMRYAGEEMTLGRHVPLAERRRVVSEINMELQIRRR